MIRVFVHGLLVAGLISQATLGGPFPYRAAVQSKRAIVRSGPGEKFYETDELLRGEVVEVYRHVNNQWCAVRPLPGSYSWVMADAVKPTQEPNVVKVIRDDVRTRVGSNRVDAHNVAYVTLKRGENLRVLGPRRTLPGTSLVAYRVAPPSGEFRWIHHRDLRRADSASASEFDASLPEEPETHEPTASAPNGVNLASFENPARFRELPKKGIKTFPIGGQVSPVEHASASGFQDRTVESARDSGAARDDLNAEEQRHAEEQRQLDRLDLRLSQTVTLPVDRWRLGTIRSQLQLLGAQGTSAKTRQRATALLKRLTQFANLQSRHLALAGAVGGQTDVQPASFNNELPEIRELPTRDAVARSDDSIYDARGWLIPVFTKRRDIPRFALTDDDGTILFFVRSNSGLNLRRYLRTRVGLIGSVQPTSASEPSQLIAHRVIVLERHE